MTDKGESKMVRAGSRTYFFDVKQTSEGRNFLVITESRFKGEDKERERQSIAVFPEGSKAFCEAVTEMMGKL